MLALYIEELTKTYKLGLKRKPIKAVDSLYLSLPEGSTFGLLGPNGAGKTTTIKAVLNLIKIDRGRIRIFGEDHYEDKVREKIGFLPEQPYFNLNLNALQTLKFYGQLLRLKQKEIKKRTEELLSEVGLENVRHLPLSKYSKGMLQRLGLALALLNNPLLLILDEPTSGLDPVGQVEVRNILLKLQKEGKTILLCSHLLTEVERLCDHIAIINQGRLILSGSTEELLREREWVTISFQPKEEKLPTALKKLKAKAVKDGSVWSLKTSSRQSNSLIEVLVKNQCQIISVKPGGSLEEVFMEAVENYGS
jgi:ABC-2 type transport system ATP-binding protein